MSYGEYILDSRQPDYFYAEDGYGEDAEMGGWLQDLGRGAQSIFRHSAATVGNTGPRRGWDVSQYERFVRELERRLQNIDRNVTRLQRAKADYERACGTAKAAIQAELTSTKAELASTKTELLRAQTLAASRGVAPTPVPTPTRTVRAPVRRPPRRPRVQPRRPAYQPTYEPEPEAQASLWSQGAPEAPPQFGDRTALSGQLLVETFGGTRAAVMPLVEGLYLVGEMPENVVRAVGSSQVADAMGREALDALSGGPSFAGNWIGRLRR